LTTKWKLTAFEDALDFFGVLVERLITVWPVHQKRLAGSKSVWLDPKASGWIQKRLARFEKRLAGFKSAWLDQKRLASS
jgi:hypothetical protein